MAKRAGSARRGTAKTGRAKRPTKVPPAEPRGALNALRDETISAEAVSEIAKSALASGPGELAKLIEEHVADPGRTATPAERATHAEDTEKILRLAIGLLRDFVTAHDEAEMPFLRVVGRITFMLTVEGGHASCTVTPIAVALLLFLQDHLDPKHRQHGKTRDTIDVTEPNILGVLYDRLEKLCSEKWSHMLEKVSAGRGFQVTDAGRFVFLNWPADISFDPTHPDLWSRKRPSARSRGISRKPRLKP